MAASARVSSSTGAMREVFEARIDDLSDYVNAFEYVPHQRGLLAIINGEVAGFDVISLESAYRMLHAKLVKSYAMDASLQRKKRHDEPSLDRAKGFLKEATLSEEKRMKSIGHGWDYRFNGKAIVGAKNSMRIALRCF